VERSASNGGPSALTSTYRVQMNAGFTFAQARARVPYFARLGISHLYCSPILAARRGSMHGYDVVDPTKVNPELGTEADLRALADDLHRHDMGLIVDIVPNHMGIGAENRYWDDVLTHGERSRYARWFDIDWGGGGSAERGRQVVLPILADELDRVLDRGELAVDLSSGSARLAYSSHSLPVDPATLPAELQLAQLDTTGAGEITRLYAGPSGRDRLRALLDAQHYRLVHWRRGPDEINYRRFFEVNDLAAVRVEDEVVFRETHAYLLELVHDGVIAGLRVDHVDGLLDPLQYLQRLRAHVRPDTPIFVEKILSPGESLRPTWPVQGTTGYEFLNALEDLFIDASGYAAIERAYRALRRLGRTTFRDIARSAKVAVLQSALRPDVARATDLALRLARGAGKSWSRDELAAGIVAFAAALPVYRTYVDGRSPIDDEDRDVVNRAVHEAAIPPSGGDCDVLSFVGSLVRGEAKADALARLEFVQRLQQLSGPAAAKGVEDTALYVYVPLLSRNEVGGAPDDPLADAAAQLHAMNLQQHTRWPLGLRCTNTHDTKRSADVRARLDALAQIPREWDRAVRRWRRLNAKHRRIVRGRIAPDTNTEYVAYQTLVAIWPAPRAHRRVDDLPDRAWRDAACERLIRYMLKAAREAKTRTNWTEPDAAYEDALRAFVRAILEPAEDAPFLVDVARLVSRVAPIAAWITLSRIAIHLTAPGTPDLYQGDELWNQTLVDPDNRRQIDYDARIGALGDLQQLEEHLRAGETVDPADPRLKLLLTNRLLAARRADPDLFRGGNYEPLVCRGARATNVFAFARTFADRHALVIAARPTEALVRPGAAAWWADTTVELPSALRGGEWRSIILPHRAYLEGDKIEVAAVLRHLPSAVLVS
jgi:(1->4)-alpha-D-glucan 1-alpha-D-glucosylmutase